MSTKQTTQTTTRRSDNVRSNSSRSNSSISQFAGWIKRLFAKDTTAGGSDLLQLYLLSRGSDSVRPAVIRKLQAGARA